MNNIRILLAQSVLEEARFLREAIEEIQESAHQGRWTSFETTHVERIDDAVAVAASSACDLILVDSHLSDGGPFEDLALLSAAAPEVPVIVIVDAKEESLAPRLLRQGAQDCLVKNEIDCVPLSRAVHNAIERQRWLSASRRVSACDELTGLYNERGFRAAAARELLLAGSANQQVLIVLMEVDNPAEIAAGYARRQRETTWLDAAAILRESAGEIALLGCLARGRFAAAVWNMQPSEFVNLVQTKTGDQPRHFAFTFGWSVTYPAGADSLDRLLADAEACLCENKQSFLITETSPLTPPIASAKACPA